MSEVKRAILFVNYSEEDFSYTWDKVVYKFPSKQSMMLEEGLAKHFARHLAIRELNKRDKNTGGGALEKEMGKALTSTSIEAPDETKLKQEVINANAKSKEDLLKEADEKGVKVDKRKSPENIQKEIEEFEGLNDE